MESGDVEARMDNLERGLLLSSSGNGGATSTNHHNHCWDEDEDEDETILFAASFAETQENFVKFQTAKWVLYSLLLILAWGVGFLMLLYLPLRRYILRKDINSRKLFLTPNSIVYKVVRPVPLPCFGVLKKEQHILLPLVDDVVIEQGYLQSLFGVYSVRIENVGVRRPPSDDVQIQGISNPHAFRKAVLTRLSNMKREAFSRQITSNEDVPNLRIGQPSATKMSSPNSCRYDSFSHTGEILLLQKLEEVGSSIKRVETLLEERHHQTPETGDQNE